ncbi:MAG: hypothetical protein HQL77_03360 [Magnetococcales bacterium]|nr:hypothetical protein [Magnetococcales bacterium]
MIKNIFCAVSGHGFGHLSQVAPILNHLGILDPELNIRVACSLDKELVARFIHVPHSVDTSVRDIGLVQSDPMVVDLAATRERYNDLQSHWQEMVHMEMVRLQDFAADLTLVDIPCVTIAAAHQLGIPSIAIASLSWDHVIKAYFSLDDSIGRGWWQRMRENYAKTTLALYPEPFIDGDTFPRFVRIPPLATLAEPRKKDLRQELGIQETDHRPLIMINLGGMPSQTVPMEQIFLEKRYHWLMKEHQLPPLEHLHGIGVVDHWHFENIVASVDAIVSKPGYGTCVNAVALGIPLLYVRRGRFPDEDPICTWLAQHACAMEIDTATFTSGKWHDAIESLLGMPHPPRPPCNGAEVAAARILTMLEDLHQPF